MKSEPIEKIRKRYKKEWLVIAVDKMDERLTKPQSGHLLAHSPRQEDLYKSMMNLKGRLFMVYSENTLPSGFAAAF